MNPGIRKAQPSDWPEIRDICSKTASAGNPIEARRWPFFSELWVGPYQRLLPEWSYVIEHNQKIIGYLTGCPDTAGFEAKKYFLFLPMLILKIVSRRYPRNGDTRRFLRQTFALDKKIEKRFSRSTHLALHGDFPAHLHVNLEAVARGGGLGRLLLERYFADLKNVGVTGVHCFCGAAPVPFYQRIGFEILEQVEASPGVLVFAMARRII